MSMRYAGFMASAREDRLIKEKREEEEAIREESWQRQIERDEAAHQRQKDLLDIRHKNALKLNGISASNAEKKRHAALKRKVDAFITINNLPDTPKVRAEISSGMEFYGAEGFMKGFKSGEIRITSPAVSVTGTERVEAPTVEAPTVDMNSSNATAPAPDLPTNEEPSGNPAGDAAAAQFDGAVYDQENKTFADAGNPPEGMVWDNTRRTFVPIDETSQMLSDNAQAEPSEEVPPAEEVVDNLEQTQEDQGGLATPTENVVSYNNNPYLKIEAIAGMEATQIEQYIRMQEQRGYSDDDLKPFRDELEFVKKAEKDPEDSFSDLIGEADSFGKLNALQAQLDALQGSGEIEAKEFGKRQDLINKAFNRLIEVNRRNAEKDGSPLLFIPFTETGTLGQDVQTLVKREGKWFDMAGSEVSAETISNGTIIIPEAYETFQRNFNTNAAKIGTTVSEGVTALQSLTNYRELVIDSPAGLNSYISVAGKLVAQANSIRSALEGVRTGQYGYETFENRVMSAIRDLSQDDARIARAQLRAAYAMAAFSGSSGQALSDKELIANLQAVGSGLTDPRKVVALINDNIDDIVTMTEQKRTTAFNSFIASPELKATMQDSPIGMPFSNYLDTGVLDEGTRRQYLDALAGKTDYAFNMKGDGSGGISIPTMTFDEFKDYVNSQPYNPDDPKDKRTVGSMYTEDELREYFKREGGKL